MLRKTPNRWTAVKYLRSSSYLEDVELSRTLLQDLVDTISMKTINLSFHYVKEVSFLNMSQKYSILVNIFDQQIC